MTGIKLHLGQKERGTIRLPSARHRVSLPFVPRATTIKGGIQSSLFINSKAPLICFLLVLGIAWSCNALQDGKGKETGMQAESQTGVLIGKVTIEPLSPVGGVEESRPPAPYAGAKLIIAQTAGDKTETAITGRDGIYRINLPAGSYRVTMAELPAGQFTKDLPATVTIRQGEEARLDVRLDTGIR